MDLVQDAPDLGHVISFGLGAQCQLTPEQAQYYSDWAAYQLAVAPVRSHQVVNLF